MLQLVSNGKWKRELTMNFLNLEYFIAAVNDMNFSETAKCLHITQQALSNHIAKMENDMGTQFFVRGRPLVLTEEGQRFYEAALEILNIQDQFMKDIKQKQSTSIDVKIGINNAVGRAILPTILTEFFEQYPNGRVKILEDTPEKLNKAISFNNLDLIIGSPLSNLPKNYHVIPLCTKEQVLIVPKKITNQLFGGEADRMREQFSKHGADLAAFETAPFIRTPSRTSSGRIFSLYCQHYKIKPPYCVELINIDNALHLACAGIGLLVYTKLYYSALGAQQKEANSRQVDIFPLPNIRGMEKLHIYYSQETKLSVATEALKDIVLKFFAAYADSNRGQGVE